MVKESKKIKNNKQTKKNRYLYTLVCFAAISGISALIVTHSTNLADSKIIGDDFLVNFLGLILGVCLAIITFLFSINDKIRESLIRLKVPDDKTDNLQKSITNCFRHIREDLLYLFIIFIVCIALIIIRDIDFPYISWTIIYFTKQESIYFAKLVILISSLLSLYDIAMSLLKLMDVGEKTTK